MQGRHRRMSLPVREPRSIFIYVNFILCLWTVTEPSLQCVYVHGWNDLLSHIRLYLLTVAADI